MNLAAVGTGRALLALGDYANAAQAVAAFRMIPFRSPGAWQTTLGSGGVLPILATSTVANGEGRNGLAYLDSQEPRSAPKQIGTSQSGQAVFTPSA